MQIPENKFDTGFHKYLDIREIHVYTGIQENGETEMTKFSDMSQYQRDQWKAWADSHSWGDTPAYFDTDNEMVTFGAVRDADGHWSEERAVHRTPAEMRAWAGY